MAEPKKEESVTNFKCGKCGNIVPYNNRLECSICNETKKDKEVE